MMTIAPHEPAAVSLDSITDLDAAMRVCDYLALSDIVPQALRGKAANIFVVYLTGRELGLSFAQALRSIYVPAGGQPQLRGSLLLAKIREAGHSYRWEYSSDGDTCTFYIRRKGEEHEASESFSVQDALMAGLVRQAPSGDIIALSRDNRPMPWQQYRHDMLFWRAVARCANRVVPELILGFEIAGAGEVQQDAVTPQPAAPAAEPGRPATEGAGEDPAAELAALDARGQAQPGMADTPAGDINPLGPAGDSSPLAGRQALKKVTDAFAALGWTPQAHREKILHACSVFCRRPVLVATDLSNKEAMSLATALGTILRAVAKDGDSLVALSDAVDGWEHDWDREDPGGWHDFLGG